MKQWPNWVYASAIFGKAETASNVLALTILVSTFLPQDRVAEFAKMTPRELLKATQEAAGDERLSEWHAKLIADGKELKQLAGVRVKSLRLLFFVDLSYADYILRRRATADFRSSECDPRKGCKAVQGAPLY